LFLGLILKAVLPSVRHTNQFYSQYLKNIPDHEHK